jgi:hypothetical protein
MKNMYEEALEALYTEFPDAKVVPKEDSFLMKAIGVFLMIITFGAMRKFMTDFVTTIGDTIYVPDGWSGRAPIPRVATLRHEAVHIRQKNRYGSFMFSLRYIWWPLPAVYAMGRLRIEQEAYEESLRAYMELVGPSILQDKQYREHIISHFTGANYFWTYPFRGKLDEWYDVVIEKLKRELSDSEQPPPN